MPTHPFSLDPLRLDSTFTQKVTGSKSPSPSSPTAPWGLHPARRRAKGCNSCARPKTGPASSASTVPIRARLTASPDVDDAGRAEMLPASNCRRAGVRGLESCLGEVGTVAVLLLLGAVSYRTDEDIGLWLYIPRMC
jgi:hypothetical protein